MVCIVVILLHMYCWVSTWILEIYPYDAKLGGFFDHIEQMQWELIVTLLEACY